MFLQYLLQFGGLYNNVSNRSLTILEHSCSEYLLLTPIKFFIHSNRGRFPNKGFHIFLTYALGSFIILVLRRQFHTPCLEPILAFSFHLNTSHGTRKAQYKCSFLNSAAFRFYFVKDAN